MKIEDISLTQEFIQQHFSDTDKEFSKKMYIEQDRIVELASSKGTLRSGMLISELIRHLNDQIDSRVNNSLQLIEDYQKEMNIKFNSELLGEIAQNYKDFYTGLYKNAFNSIEDKENNHLGNLGTNITNSLNRDMKLNELYNKIDAKIQEITIKNKVKKDEPSLIVSKKALRNSKIALVVSIITAALTFYRLFFY